MGELVKSVQKTKRGSGKTNKVIEKAVSSQKTTKSPGKTVRVEDPVTNVQTRAAAEQGSESLNSEKAVQTEDIGWKVTFKYVLNLNGVSRC